MSGRVPVRLAKIPALLSVKTPSYRAWYNTVFAIPENRPRLKAMDKAALNNIYRDLLASHMAKSEVEKYMRETNSTTGSWQQSKLRGDVEVSKVMAAGAADLRLPAVAQHHKHQYVNEGWQMQTYEDFAKKTKKMNPDIRFDKDLMDDAFVRAIEKAPKIKKDQKNSKLQKEIDRCLGRESSEYWSAQNV